MSNQVIYKELLKEKAEVYEFNTFTNAELLAQLTGIGIEKINNLLKEYTIPELCARARFHQITKTQKKKLLSLFEFGKRFNKQERKKTKITSPQDIVDYVMEDMRYLKQEHFNILILNTKNEILKMCNIFIGSLNSAIVHPREIFHTAIQYNSNSIVLLHNHPSGDPKPSKEDIEITKRLKEASKILGIDILDHIIIGDNTYYSFKENMNL